MTVEDVWQPDKTREALQVYGTDDPAPHPGVQQLMEQVHALVYRRPVEGLSPAASL